MRSLLGLDIDRDQVARLLRSIEFPVTAIDEATLAVTVPSFRIDIEREVDLVEEVARLVGYNNIPTAQPLIRMDYPRRDELRNLRQEVSQLLIAQGYFEAINYSFVAESHHDLCRLAADDPRRRVTRLLNPLSDEQAVMRSLLLPGLLENIRRNINFQRTDIRLFETGKVFLQRGDDELPEERLLLCAVLSGSRYPGAEPLHFSGQQADFLDIKGTALNLLQTLRIAGSPDAPLLRPEPTMIQPYCDATCALALVHNDEPIGTLGAVHPDTLKGFNIKQPVYFLEIDLEKLLTMERQPKQFTSLLRYPAVKRDISLTLPESTPAGELLRAITGLRQKYVETTEIFDVYRGKPIQAGYKSVALSITYRSATATLDDQTVDRVHEKIVQALTAEFKAQLREGSEA